jgi:hypothetical protein
MKDVSIFSTLFWNPKKINQLLETGELSPKTKFRYYMVFFLAGLLTYELTYYSSPSVFTIYDTLSSFLYVGISVLGVMYLFGIYKGNVSFIEKAVILSTAIVPIYFLFCLLIAPIYWLSYIWYDHISDETTLVDAIFMGVITVLYFWMLRKYFATEQNSGTGG